MDDLVVFLRARLAEEKAEAEVTAEEYGSIWTANEGMETVQGNRGADVVEGPNSPLDYIARHDPARVLAEVEAKLRMLRHYESAVTSLANAGTSGQVHDLMTGAVNTLRAVLLDHAQVYATHPDFKPEWSTA